MISTLKEVRDALEDLKRQYGEHPDAFWDWTKARAAITKLDALIAQVGKAEPQYLSIERVEGFPEKLEQGPQPLLYSDGINGCMVRHDDVWLALTSQLAIPHSAPSTSPLTDDRPDCTPNHFCKGRMVHLPLGEVCDRCGFDFGAKP